MKNLIAFLTFVFFSGPMMGHNGPELGTMQVYAPSGLKLRIHPSTDGEVLKVIPYGDKVAILDEMPQKERIEWMSGHWMKVEHQGTEGFLFGGFISELPMPKNDFELSQNDLDITYPLISWAEHNYDEVRASDTLFGEHITKVTQYLESGLTLTRRDTKYDFTVILEIENGVMEDAYNLVRSMLRTTPERISFDNNSVFKPDISGEIHRINIQIDNPVEIRKMKNGTIKVLVTSFHQGCDLF